MGPVTKILPTLVGMLNLSNRLNKEPILRLRNLQQQRQRCSRLEFFKVEENIFGFKTHLARIAFIFTEGHLPTYIPT
jgi:hypothetical protein